MQEKAWLCLAASFLGIAALLAAASSAVPQIVSPDQLSMESAGSFVLVSGQVRSVRVSNGSVFLLLCRNSCVGVVVFPSLARQLAGAPSDPAAIRPGASVSVEGVVEARGDLISIVPLGPDSIEYN